jgi:hypothetical protein
MRHAENVLARLKEQMGFLHTSLRAFYAGNFAESVRIATVIRVLVHESGMSNRCSSRPSHMVLNFRFWNTSAKGTGRN